MKQLSEIDIGIMPLPDNQWTRGKCGFKGLQYMSLGIPTVMSNVGVNIDIIEQGENGFLANTTEDWISYLSALIDDEKLRKKLGASGRNTIEKRYSVEANKQNYLDAFAKAMEIKKAKRA
jgi:glycosyltransferase involved in cell wall biosynthesis